MSDFDRMYTRGGRTAHLVRRTIYGVRVAACGRYPWPGEFLGTGDQAEYERAARLPLCRHCERSTQPPVRPAAEEDTGRTGHHTQRPSCS